MNYEPNTKRWGEGSLVLHDADVKEAKMLMRVIGYTREGLCAVEYIEPSQPRTVYENDIKYLHDPRQWLEYWNGYPVLATEPKVCPICDSAEIDVNRMPEDDEFDEALARQCGLTGEWSEIWDQHPEFAYNYAEMHCENDYCGAVVAYGERGYYNKRTNFYDHKKPSPEDYPGTPEYARAKAEAERLAQEAAGQQRLFDTP